jgi:hypothetical protein
MSSWLAMLQDAAEMFVSQYAMLEAIIEFLREECCVNSKIA